MASVFGAPTRRRRRTLGAILGLVAGSVLRIRRRHVEAAMRRAGVADPRASARAMYRALGESACEFLWLARAPRELDSVVRIAPDSAELLAALVAEGRGVVLAASHTGNWDLAACAVARVAPLTVVTKRLHAPALDAFWQGTRAGYGVRLVEARGAAAVASGALGRGELVAMMIDQVPSDPRRAVRAPFLGADVLVDRAPAVLAARAGAPLVVSAARRLRDGTHELAILEVIDPPARAAQRAAWVEEASRVATATLARFVLAHPSEWLWLHRRWRLPSGAPRLLPPVDAHARVE